MFADDRVYAVFIDVMGFADSIDALTESEHAHLDEALRNPLKTDSWTMVPWH